MRLGTEDVRRRAEVRFLVFAHHLAMLDDLEGLNFRG